MSAVRLYDGTPTDALVALLAAILHHLIAGPVNHETYRDLVVLAKDVVRKIDTGGKCEDQTIETEDLIEAIVLAEQTYDSDCELDPDGVRTRAGSLARKIYPQMIELKNQKAIEAVIQKKGLTCGRCAVWHSLPAEGQKSSMIYKHCNLLMEVYAESTACAKIHPIHKEDFKP